MFALIGFKGIKHGANLIVKIDDFIFDFKICYLEQALSKIFNIKISNKINK